MGTTDLSQGALLSFGADDAVADLKGLNQTLAIPRCNQGARQEAGFLEMNRRAAVVRQDNGLTGIAVVVAASLKMTLVFRGLPQLETTGVRRHQR